jgi:formamidase
MVFFLMIIFCIDADDIRDCNLLKCHNLSGPIAVEGAEPGDALVLDILDGQEDVFAFWLLWLLMKALVTYYEKMPWGYSVISSSRYNPSFH